MKKCASCSKDLPEAALHCVFCGAKQAPAPAVGPGLAKTAFGYGNPNDMQQLRNQAQQYVPPQPPQPQYQQPPRQQPPSQPPPQQYGGYQPPPQQYGGVAPSPANAATVFATGGPPQMQPPQPQTYNAGAMQAAPGGGLGIHSQHQHTPQPLPPSQSPYLGQTTGHSGHPVEPWQDSLKLWMLIWGAVTLVAFATPVATDPQMVFNWDAIIHGEGKAKIPMLIVSAVGLLSVVLSLLPMVVLPRGILAAALGLVGIFVPLALSSFPPWQGLLVLVGTLALVPGLLVRNEYVESLLARVLVTIGVICVLATYLVPVHGDIPLVGLFKGLIDLPGEAKVPVLLELFFLVIVVLSLLCWMPGPATGGGKVFAWVIILYPVLVHVVGVVLAGHLGDAISKAPFETIDSWVPEVTYSVLAGYGIATVIGKQLE